MWKPSLLTRSFGPWIPDVESCLSFSCHIQVQTASTALSTDFSKMYDARAYALAYTRGKFIYDARAYALASSGMRLEQDRSVTYIKPRFPHFVLFGDVGVQQMWKPHVLPRSFGPRILDSISSLFWSYHRQVHTMANPYTSIHGVFSHEMCSLATYKLSCCTCLYQGRSLYLGHATIKPQSW